MARAKYFDLELNAALFLRCPCLQNFIFPHMHFAASGSFGAVKSVRVIYCHTEKCLTNLRMEAAKH
ncbi:MAG: hypothetical protein ABSH41_29270 [Syntrophobacteraceae bacterium]